MKYIYVCIETLGYKICLIVSGICFICSVVSWQIIQKECLGKSDFLDSKMQFGLYVIIYCFDCTYLYVSIELII